MTIKNGFKMEAKERGFYTVVESEEEASVKASQDVSWRAYGGYTLTSIRYVTFTGRFFRYQIVNEGNLIDTLYSIFSRATFIQVVDNPYLGKDDEYTQWDSIIESGKSYMVGRDVSTKHFLRTHTSSASDWQQLAYEWALANPSKLMILNTGGTRQFCWHVNVRGEYVEYSLPHHDAGGEKNYVVKIGSPKRKVLVNVD